MNASLFHYQKQTEQCPQCGSILQIRQGKKGLFLGCSAFPNCDYLKPLQPHSESKVLKELSEICPECGQHLQVKQGQFGIFIGCSGYPNCHFIVQEHAQPPKANLIPCPECGKGELVARRGRQGKTFYGCNQFPQCKFTIANQPEPITCPNCGGKWASLKKTTPTHRSWLCLNKGCKQVFDVENEI